MYCIVGYRMTPSDMIHSPSCPPSSPPSSLPSSPVFSPVSLPSPSPPQDMDNDGAITIDDFSTALRVDVLTSVCLGLPRAFYDQEHDSEMIDILKDMFVSMMGTGEGGEEREYMMT